VLAGIAYAVLSGGSSSNKSASSKSAGKTRATSHKGRSSAKAKSGASSTAASRAETMVSVLNGTNTTGLAHRIAGQLQQDGYSQATALSGTPPGSNAVTVVEYLSGHRAEAQAVAQSLSVSQVQPMESGVAALAGPAPVAVVVGADRATGAGSEESTAVP
jgi:hypothetical protein